MILVCPSCDSKFKVPDNVIPPEGRKVRCAQCGSAWHATTANELKSPKPAMAPKTPTATEIDAGTSARAAAIRQAVVEPEGPAENSCENFAPEEGLFDEGLEGPAVQQDMDEEGYSDDFDVTEASDDALSEEFDEGNEEEFEDDFEAGDDIMARRRRELRREAEQRSKATKRRLVTVGWIALLVFILGTLGSLVFAKDAVTKAFPGTHQLYDFFAESRSGTDKYLPAEGERITPPITETEVYVKAGIIQERTRLETVDGQSHVVIGGELENTGNRAANVPKVEISIKDRQGNVLDQWVFDPPGLVLRRLSKLPFETRRPVPPGMASVAIRALEGTKSSNEAPSRL